MIKEEITATRETATYRVRSLKTGFSPMNDIKQFATAGLALTCCHRCTASLADLFGHSRLYMGGGRGLRTNELTSGVQVKPLAPTASVVAIASVM